jgi:hypothetical protein
VSEPHGSSLDANPVKSCFHYTHIWTKNKSFSGGKQKVDKQKENSYSLKQNFKFALCAFSGLVYPGGVNGQYQGMTTE